MDEKVKLVLARVLQIPVEIVTDDLTMKDVDSWDSLKHMDLVVSLEESFNLQFTFPEIVAMQKVSAIKNVLLNKGVLDGHESSR